MLFAFFCAFAEKLQASATDIIPLPKPSYPSFRTELNCDSVTAVVKSIRLVLNFCPHLGSFGISWGHFRRFMGCLQYSVTIPVGKFWIKWISVSHRPFTSRRTNLAAVQRTRSIGSTGGHDYRTHRTALVSMMETQIPKITHTLVDHLWDSQGYLECWTAVVPSVPISTQNRSRNWLTL